MQADKTMSEEDSSKSTNKQPDLVFENCSDGSDEDCKAVEVRTHSVFHCEWRLAVDDAWNCNANAATTCLA